MYPQQQRSEGLQNDAALPAREVTARNIAALLGSRPAQVCKRHEIAISKLARNIGRLPKEIRRAILAVFMASNVRHGTLRESL
jgi:hypothetical protein